MDEESETFQLDSDGRRNGVLSLGENNIQINNCQINITNSVVHIGGKVENVSDPNRKRKDSFKKKLQNQAKTEKSVNWVTLLPARDRKNTEKFNVDSHYVPLKINVIDVCTNRKQEIGSLQDFYSKLTSGNQIFVESDVGNGKSILCRKTFYDWTKRNDEHLAKFNYSFYIPISNQEFTGNTIVQMICQTILGKNGDEDEKFILDVLQEIDEECLFILDDLDHMNGDHAEIVKQAFAFLPLACFLVTSRPLNNDSTAYQHFTESFHLEGLSEKGKEKFINDYFKDVDKLKKFSQYTFVDAQDECAKKCLDILKSTPLLLHLLCHSVRTKSEKPKWKVTDLYNNICHQLICYFEFQAKNLKRPIDRLKVRKGLVNFGQLALKALLEKREIVSEKEINSLQYGRLVVELGFLKKNSFYITEEEKEKLQKYVDEESPTFYKTIDSTFLEYSAALYLSELRDKPEEFNEKFSGLQNLLHSKTNKHGARTSLFMIFTCALLKCKAHLLFSRVFSADFSKDRYKNFDNFCLLLWHSGFDNENVSTLAKCGFIPNDLQWVFNKDFNSNSTTRLVLSELLSHPDCRLTNLIVSEVNLLATIVKWQNTLFSDDFSNVSVTHLEIVQAKADKSAKLDSKLSEIAFSLFLKFIPKFQNLTSLVVNADITVNEEPNLCKNFLKELMQVVKSLPNLTKFSILATRLHEDSTCCGNFFGYDIGNNVVHNSSKESRKKRNKMCEVKISTEHLLILINSLAKISIQELHLPHLNVDKFSFNRLCKLILSKQIIVVKLPYLKICGRSGLSALTDVLQDENCKLKELDLKGYECEQAEFDLIGSAIRSNRSLTSLNLSLLIKFETDLNPFCDAICFNTILQKLHLSSNEKKIRHISQEQHDEEGSPVPETSQVGCEDDFGNFVADDNLLIIFFYYCTQSKLTEIHLANWIIELKDADTVNIIVKLIRDSHLKKICLQKCGVKLYFFNGTEEELVEGKDIVIQFLEESGIEVLDVRDMTVESGNSPDVQRYHEADVESEMAKGFATAISKSMKKGSSETEASPEDEKYQIKKFSPKDLQRLLGIESRPMQKIIFEKNELFEL